MQDCGSLSLAAPTVNDSTLMFWEAVTFKHCCPPQISSDGEICQGGSAIPGCAASCSLAPHDSYLARKGQPGVSLWSGLWNAVAFEIHDLVDILEYQIVQQVKTLRICNQTYSQSFVVQDIVNRSRKVLELSMIPQWDEVRHKMMRGVCEPLDTNFEKANMARINYCWHFHAASAVEPIARFVRVMRQAQAPLISMSLLDELLHQTQQVLQPYWSEWDTNASTYVDAADAEYMNASRYRLAYNQAASIGMTYVEVWEAGGSSQYLDRAVHMARRFEQANSARRIHTHNNACACTWSYDPLNDRVEDPDHATEELRLAIRLVRMDRGLFSKEVLHRLLATWFSIGVNEHDCLTRYVDGHCSPCNATRLVDVASRDLFILRYMPPLFEKFTGVRAWRSCTASKVCSCSSADER